MKWYYLKDRDFPMWNMEILIKCAGGDFLKTGIQAYDDDDDYYKKPYAVSFYTRDGFLKLDTPSLRWINVVAWCYVGDVYDELQEQGNTTVKEEKKNRVY